ncbi:type II toxin-antitoxin system HicB family antitoxin [Cupriavidus sp. YAF13]|uniref:type II toxin-antitoxin system HicB family antitoxin n=1 Tax=Cupriavidus sp. YAF13 TaxID=3233075 RepID=UPI003F8F944F
MQYPAIFTPDVTEDGRPAGFVVSFRDIPEAITQGDTEVEACEMAADALLTAMDFYFEDKRPVPPPSKAEEGERLVALPLSAAAKVLLLNEMLAQQVRPSDLATRLGTTKQEVNRLIDLGHTTKIDRIAEAMAALGKRLELSVA